jgi:hypothetical protein
LPTWNVTPRPPVWRASPPRRDRSRPWREESADRLLPSGVSSAPVVDRCATKFFRSSGDTKHASSPLRSSPQVPARSRWRPPLGETCFAEEVWIVSVSVSVLALAGTRWVSRSITDRRHNLSSRDRQPGLLPLRRARNHTGERARQGLLAPDERSRKRIRPPRPGPTLAGYRPHPEDLPAEPERDSSTSERGAGYFLSGLLPPLWLASIPPSFSPAHGYDWLGLTPPRARIRVSPSTPALTSCLALGRLCLRRSAHSDRGCSLLAGRAYGAALHGPLCRHALRTAQGPVAARRSPSRGAGSGRRPDGSRRPVAGPGGSDPTKSCTRSAPAIRPARPLSRFTAATTPNVRWPYSSAITATPPSDPRVEDARPRVEPAPRAAPSTRYAATKNAGGYCWVL